MLISAPKELFLCPSCSLISAPGSATPLPSWSAKLPEGVPPVLNRGTNRVTPLVKPKPPPRRKSNPPPRRKEITLRLDFAVARSFSLDLSTSFFSFADIVTDDIAISRPAPPFKANFFPRLFRRSCTSAKRPISDAEVVVST